MMMVRLLCPQLLREGHVEMVKLLAERGADINIKAKAPATVILAGGEALNLFYWRR